MKFVIEVEKPEGCHSWCATYVDGQSPLPENNTGYSGVGATPQKAIMALFAFNEIQGLFRGN